MDDEVNRTLLIDERLESYRTIFGHGWCQSVFAVAEGTKLEIPLMTLSASWRAAANTHTMPWLFIHSLHHLWHGAAKHQGLTSRFVAAMSTAIPKRMEGKITRTQQQRLARAVQELADEIKQVWENEPDIEMEPESLWKDYLTKPECWEFKLAIWGSQQLIFGALFFAFEHFVTTLVSIGKGDLKYRPRWPDLVSDAKALLDPVDPSLVSKCLEGQFIEIARLTRNCLAHRGGRVSDELAKIAHGLPVLNGVVQITSPCNEQCIRHLERRVAMLVDAAVKLSAFQA